MVESRSEICDKTKSETCFYITSLTREASHMAAIVRDHWIMDMVFRDDECRIQTDHAPANFTTPKHIALNLIRQAPGKDLLHLKRKVAACDDNFLLSVINQRNIHPTPLSTRGVTPYSAACKAAGGR
jgi:hypothetical protein